ncbi:MAG: DUF2062 domain-containing protein [Polyangiaceae bacterium]
MKSLSTRAVEARAALGRALRWLRGTRSPARAGLSVGLGMFIGCLPLYGLHLPLCLAVCLPFGLDAVLAYVAANISNPFVAPFLLTAEVEVGSRLLHGHGIAFDWAAAQKPNLSAILAEVALGSVVVGALLGLFFGVVTGVIAQHRGRAVARPDDPLDGARKRTVQRYASAPPGDRYYVAAKLHTDPSVSQIAALGPLGDVIDAGCGRGQLGLCLAELGHLQRLVGFDFDARKVSVAQRAAGERADYRVDDLGSAELGSADSILLVDVLHYLDVADQDRLLERAARCLRGGGRIIVREVDAASARKSFFTRGFERIATRVGYNRSRSALGFRPLAEIRARLEALGLRCQVESEAAPALLENRLLVACSAHSRGMQP